LGTNGSIWIVFSRVFVRRGTLNAGVLSQRDERNAAGSRRIKAKVGDLEYRVFHRFFLMTKCPTPVTKYNLLENFGSNKQFTDDCVVKSREFAMLLPESRFEKLVSGLRSNGTPPQTPKHPQT